MSQVKVSGNASGTGVFTIAAPNSNTDRTLTLPNNTGTFLTTASAGTVLQVLQATTTTSTSTTSTSYVDVTNLTVTITPTSTSSKILVLVDFKYYIQADNATTGGVQIVRSGTAIYTDDRYAQNNVNANVATGVHGSFIYLDSPATTSSTVYKVQIKRTLSAGTSYDFQVNSASGNTSSITVMEVAG